MELLYFSYLEFSKEDKFSIKITMNLEVVWLWVSQKDIQIM